MLCGGTLGLPIADSEVRKGGIAMDATNVKMHVFLDTCWEVENISAELYHFFADHFIDDPWVSRLWRKTAKEEESHARQVLLAKKLMESIVWVSIESWRNASLAREEVKQIASSAQKFPPTLKDALLLGLQCEYSMDYLHMQNALLMKEKASNDMFKAMMNQDRGHIRRLEAALYRMQRKTAYDLEFIEPDDYPFLEALNFR
jgi:rubrerythrin